MAKNLEEEKFFKVTRLICSKKPDYIEVRIFKKPLFKPIPRKPIKVITPEGEKHIMPEEVVKLVFEEPEILKVNTVTVYGSHSVSINKLGDIEFLPSIYQNMKCKIIAHFDIKKELWCDCEPAEKELLEKLRETEHLK